MKRILVLTVVMLIGLLLIPSAVALADQSYHTERFPLTITSGGAGHPLRNGMVVNIHPNGPTNGAIEKYILNGAQPGSTYEVWWDIDGEIDGQPIIVAMPTGIVVETDSRGNGQGILILSLTNQAGFRGFDGNVTWLFKANGITAFQTDWAHVVVD